MSSFVAVYVFELLTQASSVLEFVDQSGCLVARGEAMDVYNSVAIIFICFLWLCSLCFCVPYPSKLMLELVNQSGRLVVRGEAVVLF